MVAAKTTNEPQPLRLLLPLAPGDYDAQYMNTLVKAITLAFQQIQNPQNLQATGLHFYNLPTSGAMLTVGDVFSDGGILKIVLESTGYPASLTIVSAIGNVIATGS